MTSHDLVHIMLRRWFVVAFFILCAVITVFVLDTKQRHYVAQTELVMVAPGSVAVSGSPYGSTETLVDFAGVVERRFNASSPTQHLSSPSATLFGNGIRNGVSVRLTNSGGQWNYSFDRPILEVQVIDSNIETVHENMQSVESRVRKIVHDLQTDAHAKPKSMISVYSDTEGANITSFGSTRTGRVKGIALICGVAVVISVPFSIALDKLLKRRKAHTNMPATTGISQLENQPKTMRHDSAKS